MPKPVETGQSQRGEAHNPQWLWATRVVILVAFLDLFMQFPVIAPYARSLGASNTLVGIIVAAYSATNLIGNLVAGAILDRFGRRWTLLIGLVATAIALSGYAISRTPQQLLVARTLHGLTASVLTPGSFAILGDSTHAKDRARAMGLSGAVIAVAAVVGPPIAGVVRDRSGSEAVFVLVAVLMLVTFLFSWYFSRRWTPVSADSRAQDHAPAGLVFWLIPRLMASYLAASMLTIGLGVLVTHLPTAMAARGESATRTGLAFTSFALAAMIAMATPLNRLSDRFGRLYSMMAGLSLVTAGMLVLLALTDFRGYVIGMGIFGFGFGILFPAMTAVVAEVVRWRLRGKAFGMFYAIFSMGVVIGSVASGLLTDKLGDTTTLPYLVSAIAALIAIPAIGFIWRLRQGKPIGD